MIFEDNIDCTKLINEVYNLFGDFIFIDFDNNINENEYRELLIFFNNLDL